MPYVALRVSGSSMWPLLNDGQRVLIDSGVAPGDLRRGDVLAVEAPTGRMLLHRLVERRRDGALFTRGDSCVNREGPLRPERLAGRLVGVESDAGADRWRPPRPWVARGLARLSGLRPKWLVRPLQLLARPLAFGAPFSAAAQSLARPVHAEDAEPRDAETKAPPPNGIEVQELGDELVIHDRRTGDVHVLDGLARAIFQWAGKGLDREAITDELARAYPAEDRARLRAGVDDVLGRLESLGGPR